MVLPEFALDLIRCITGPKLFMIYGNQQDPKYKANFLEYFADTTLYISLIPVKNATMVASCFFMYSFLRGGYSSIINGWSPDRFKSYGTNITAYFLLMGFTYICRGLGRFINSDYRTFLNTLRLSSTAPKDEALAKIRKYDFSFDQWPVSYRWAESLTMNPPPKPPLELEQLGISHPTKPFRPPPAGSSFVHRGKSIIYQTASHYLSTVILRRLIYPGSVSLFVAPVAPQLHQMRADLIRQFNGKRFKLEARDTNHIDSLFVDQRQTGTRNGSFLFVCCEGNFGFYEIGITTAALSAGYSVLGWNHPGFMGSSGEPFPDQEVNAVDVVLRFATHKLGFTYDKIVLYGWSIGSFPATYAALSHPDVRGLILDAAFDHVEGLALSRTPPPLRNIVKVSIGKYFDLNVAKLLSQYSGPVLLVRRSFEEITCMDPDNSRPTNRINGLLLSLIQSRYPGLLDSDDEDDRKIMTSFLEDWLKNEKEYQTTLLSRFAPNEHQCIAMLNSTGSISQRLANGNEIYPIDFSESPLSLEDRQMLFLYIISQHWGEFGSTHCAPLPPSYLKLPFDLAGEIRNRSKL